ncbi:MAG: AIM24 family protein, partial [Rhodanobacter sp.]
MAAWFFSYGKNTERVGPLDDAAAMAQARRQPDGYCWREGFTEWKAIRSVAELGAAMGPPPVPATLGSGRADEIDYTIVGTDMQFVEIELDPGESAIAEAGALMYKEAGVQMDTVFGDGSSGGQSGGGLMDKLLSAGKRVITGESLFTTVFTHRGQGKARVAFAAPYPGTVLAMKLSDHGGRLICQ